MKKHILPILLVLLMILLAGCSKPSGLPQNTEISSSSVGQFSELKQDENLTDEPSISTTENTASSTENKVVSEPTESQEKEDKKPASSESKPTEETPKTTEKAENKPAETKPAETQQTEPTQPKTNPTEESKEPETESEPEPVYQVPERSEVEALVAAYINQYRSTNATVLSGLTSVARYRSNQLVTNFAHTDGIDACNALQYGVYTVHQVSGWEGRELMPDFEVYIAQDETTYRYLINNANFESYVRVVKVDAETEKTIPYAGAAFKIFNPDGELVKMSFTYPTPTTIDTFYTDANGSLVTPEKLPYGKGYFLVEVEAPYGYVLDTTPVYFDVTEDNSTTEESGVTVYKREVVLWRVRVE